MSAAWLGDASDEEPEKSFLVNTEFAARLEHNKRREELHRLEAKHANRPAHAALKRKADAAMEQEELTESSSDDDEEDDWVEGEAEQRKLLDTIARIRNRDSTIYDPASKLHSEGSEGEDEEADAVPAPKPKKQKAMRLAEVNMREALAGPDADDRGGREPLPDTYQGELQSLKDQFLEAAGNKGAPPSTSRDGDDLLEKRPLPSDASLAAVASRPEKAITVPLDAADPEDAFLQRFILTQGWRDADDNEAPAFDQMLKDVDDEEEQLDREEQYEAKYNFRFEEPGAKQVITFPRQLGNSLRKPDDRRKKQRESHAQNKLAVKQEAETEVKRLKNLKKQELQERQQLRIFSIPMQLQPIAHCSKSQHSCSA
ncbi:hypothetical protein WJX84_010677 [Apatococcus fuscideae]|uniref:Protein KRI1 homolog n=1 Tax=Apatococcus fuscideae TaxID=2026836 RepID=A0AAW1T6E7_9CHLO